ncbi:MAG: hypothetical protein PHD11_07895 [Bacteroidales bacterium]|nr:hypothetical protein [Bacteroidales bacterium]MDD4671100.1 hypothetical protein [Bacteroidales bacterium]
MNENELTDKQLENITGADKGPSDLCSSYSSMPTCMEHKDICTWDASEGKTLVGKCQRCCLPSPGAR